MSGRVARDAIETASGRYDAEKPGMVFERDSPLPLDLTRDKDKIKVRIEPETGVYAGPIYGIRLFGAGEI